MFSNLLLVLFAVTPLPDDGGVYHLSIFLNDNYKSTKEREILSWFETNPTLRSIKAQSQFHVYTKSDAIYKSTFVKAVPTTPCVVLQSSTGQVYYKRTNPKSAMEVSVEMSKAIRMQNHHLLRRVRPSPRPGPCPEPPVTDEEVTPDETPIPESPPMAIFPWELLLLAIVVAGAITAFFQFRTRSK